MNYKRLIKCSTCQNVVEGIYIGSRNINAEGEVADIVGSSPLWMSYFKCPECGAVEVEFHPVGEAPDIPEEAFFEVGKDGKPK